MQREGNRQNDFMNNLIIILANLVNMHTWIIVVIYAISSLCLSCKKCETRYEPDFTEDELSWVRFEATND